MVMGLDSKTEGRRFESQHKEAGNGPPMVVLHLKPKHESKGVNVDNTICVQFCGCKYQHIPYH